LDRTTEEINRSCPNHPPVVIDLRYNGWAKILQSDQPRNRERIPEPLRNKNFITEAESNITVGTTPGIDFHASGSQQLKATNIFATSRAPRSGPAGCPLFREPFHSRLLLFRVARPWVLPDVEVHHAIRD
jgi:hypothetical protein